VGFQITRKVHKIALGDSSHKLHILIEKETLEKRNILMKHITQIRQSKLKQEH